MSPKARLETLLSVALVPLALLAFLTLRAFDPSTPFRDAAAHIEKRLKPGELILLHPPGNSWYADEFQKLPVFSFQTLGSEDLRGLPGVWIVSGAGHKAAARAYAAALKAFARSGSIKKGGLTVLHYWEPRPILHKKNTRGVTTR